MIRTSKSSGDHAGLTIGITVFCLCLAWILFVLWWKRKELRNCQIRAFGHQEMYAAPPASQHGHAQESVQHYFEEFRTISQMEVHQICTVAQNPINAPKNRYRDVIPYDATRVVLLNGKNGDYINASYIEGMFIATQDPFPDQDEDFWQMIWLSNTSVIIRLSSNSAELPIAQYFPNIENNTWVFGPEEIKVTSAAFHHLGDTRVIHLRAEKKGVQRHIVLFHFTSWLAGKIPPSSDVLELVSTAKGTREKLGGGTVLVHCGAGSGRSGTIIAIWQIMDAFQRGLPVDVPKIVADLRHQRPGMVQTQEQYAFLYKCLKKYSSSPFQWSGKDVFMKIDI